MQLDLVSAGRLASNQRSQRQHCQVWNLKFEQVLVLYVCQLAIQYLSENWPWANKLNKAGQSRTQPVGELGICPGLET